MDWVTVAIGLGVCLITALVLYLISVYSFKEHTFEEALAEQQKFANSLLKADKGSTKEKEKKPKKAAKKNKDKEKREVEPTSVGSSAVVDGKHPHVEFEPDEEIIPEESGSTQSEGEKKKADKKEKGKPILRNSDSSPCTTQSNDSFDPDVDTINHFGESAPKDDMELKAKDPAVKSVKSKGPKAVEEKIVAEVAVVEPVAVKEVAFLTTRNTGAQPQQHGTPKKQQRKKVIKNDALETIDGGEELLLLLGGTEKLLSALRRLPLSVAELQTMIEVLLNRQQEASGTFESEWMERGGRLDPIAALRKQLADKEKLMMEELEEKQSYQNKLRTLGTEIAAERTRAGQARNQLEEALNRQTGEITGLNMRIQQLVEHHANELVAMKNNFLQAQKASMMSDDHLRQIQRLQEEKGQFAAVQQDMASRVQQLEEMIRHKDQHLDELLRHKEQRMEQEVKLQNQVALLEVQLQESEQVRSAMLMESDQSLQAQQEMIQLREALNQQEAQFRQSAIESHARFEELERTKQLLEDRITTSDRELITVRNIASQKESESQLEVQRFSDEKQQLVQQLEEALAQQSEQSFDDVTVEALMMKNEAALAAERATAADKESQLNTEIQRLQDDNQKLAQQLSTVETELSDKSLQVVEEDRAIAAEKESEFQTELQRLRDENQELANKLSSLPQIQENHEEEARLEALLKVKEEELEVTKSKNNELRDKNYKAMDALAEAEKALVLSKKSANSSSDVQQSIGASLLQVFPELTFDATASPSFFSENVASQMAFSLKRLQEDEQSKAQAQVLHYKTVLSQTEEVLIQLQSRVEAEEQSWKTKMLRLESEITATKQEREFWMEQCRKQEATEQLSTDVTSLESKLETLQKEKEQLIQDMEKVRLEKTTELEQSQQQLLAVEEMAAREKEATQLLREQLDTLKAGVPTKMTDTNGNGTATEEV